MIERRKSRSSKMHEAINLFMAALKERTGLAAVALTNEDGFLVAGAGEKVDLEWMGALGASSRRSSFRWEDQTLHVEQFKVNDVELYLTCAGRRVPAASIAAGLQRILFA